MPISSFSIHDDDVAPYENWMQVFAMFDIKHNGVIDFGEFVHSLSIFHPNASQEKKIECMKLVVHQRKKNSSFICVRFLLYVIMGWIKSKLNLCEGLTVPMFSYSCIWIVWPSADWIHWT